MKKSQQCFSPPWVKEWTENEYREIVYSGIGGKHDQEIKTYSTQQPKDGTDA